MSGSGMEAGIRSMSLSGQPVAEPSNVAPPLRSPTVPNTAVYIRPPPPKATGPRINPPPASAVPAPVRPTIYPPAAASRYPTTTCRAAAPLHYPAFYPRDDDDDTGTFDTSSVMTAVSLLSD